MKKKICVLIPAVILLLALSGCSCSHEWMEADCVTPKTCSKCDAVEGEALGHDYLPASCTTPETCARCGETRGDVLEHSYGEWFLGETEMIRSCQSCGAEETAEVTPELYARQLMIGHWDFLLLIQDGDITDAYRREDAYVAYWAKADADGSFCLRVGEDKEFALRWEYSDYDPEKNVYAYTMTRQDTQGQLSAYLMQQENGMRQLVLPFAEGVQIYLFQDSRLTEGMAGTWQDTEDGVDYSLTLAPDRTFTGDVEGQVSGTWYLRPLKMYHESYHYMGITLLGKRGEEPFEHFVLIALWGDPTEYDVVEELQRTGYFSLALREDGSKVDFRRVRE